MEIAIRPYIFYSLSDKNPASLNRFIQQIYTQIILLMNKLDLIRQKYGYAPSNHNLPEANSQRFNSIQRDDQRTVKPLHSNQHQLSHNRISLFLLDSPTQHNSKNQCQPKQTHSHIQTNPVPPQNTTVLTSKKVPDLNRSFVESYEKTYDLLKNYRNRILTSTQRPDSQSKSKIILNPNNAPSRSSVPQQQMIENKGKESKPIAQVKKRLSSKKYPQRCSPLQGIDFQSSVNLYGEIQNISRLQSRIHQLIKDKSLR